MGRTHIVEQGEHLFGIANKYGFGNFETIWSHPDNSKLRNLRKNPNVLFPGDKVVIPDKIEQVESIATTKVHRFQVRRQKLLLQIIIRDIDDKAVGDTFYSLKVKEDVHAQKTDASGMTKDEINGDDRDGNLHMPDKKIDFRLKIGHLNPLIVDPQKVEEPRLKNEAITAWQDRLNNLGYFAGFTAKDSKQLRWAIEEFQCEHGWTPEKHKKPNGNTDQETRDKLEEVYGC